MSPKCYLRLLGRRAAAKRASESEHGNRHYPFSSGLSGHLPMHLQTVQEEPPHGALSKEAGEAPASLETPLFRRTPRLAPRLQRSRRRCGTWVGLGLG